MSLESVRAAYASRAAEYIEAVGSIDDAAPSDLERVLQWARGVEGLVLDVGSGPGQWTDLLRSAGVEVEGVEPVAEFLAAARRRYPECRFRDGRAEDLRVADGSLGGILAWYSLIHTDPADIGVPLAEFARSIRPGGSLLVGFFTGTDLEPFDHAVIDAYYWPAGLLASRIEDAGFSVVDVLSRSESGAPPRPGRRPQAIIRAVRNARPHLGA
ncbi:class I SAM-dependent methyltransferase [Leucobacter sp. wl10]|uniref:class I SAM-dependent methyltransferase n=1 Tax=Leucobacter sp. wl10 TaxID=2304677 RepID=UPI000E5C41D8|nr:class I SAM-dependent methyltransferase [Leucobacter sp. wl10]RGE17635.1 class I SAM-dependent methyltransferase [Leucobacter sp. wl10]